MAGFYEMTQGVGAFLKGAIDGAASAVMDPIKSLVASTGEASLAGIFSSGGKALEIFEAPNAHVSAVHGLESVAQACCSFRSHASDMLHVSPTEPLSPTAVGSAASPVVSTVLYNI